MSAMDRITVDPTVCGGRPCIRGIRIRVKDVLDLLAAGATRDEILADYPYLEPDDITAVVWLRLGNTRRTTVLNRVEGDLPAIVAALQRGETLVEIA